MPTNWFSQYSFKRVLPIFMFSSQSRFQVSSLVDRTLVTVGPRARWAPEQFIHIKTPKSRETPGLVARYSMGIWHCNQHRARSTFSAGGRWVPSIAAPLSAFKYLFLLIQCLNLTALYVEQKIWNPIFNNLTYISLLLIILIEFTSTIVYIMFDVHRQ